MNLGGSDGSLLIYDYCEKTGGSNNSITESDIMDKKDSVVTGDDLSVVILAIMGLCALIVFSLKIKKNYQVITFNSVITLF